MRIHKCISAWLASNDRGPQLTVYISPDRDTCMSFRSLSKRAPSIHSPYTYTPSSGPSTMNSGSSSNTENLNWSVSIATMYFLAKVCNVPARVIKYKNISLASDRPSTHPELGAHLS
jgi:hypothetical protein